MPTPSTAPDNTGNTFSFLSNHTPKHPNNPFPEPHPTPDNTGNTCFLNSALQCLAATSPLRDYFLQGRHEGQGDPSNPLGTGGVLTRYVFVFGLV